MGEVVPLELVEVGEDFRLDPERVILDAIDEGLAEIVIIGTCANGDRYLASNVNTGVTLLMLMQAQHRIVTAEDDD